MIYNHIIYNNALSLVNVRNEKKKTETKMSQNAAVKDETDLQD